MSLDNHYTLRGQIADLLTRDLVGPSALEAAEDDEKIINEDPVSRYPVGVLFPATGEALAAESDVDGEGRGSTREDETTEDEPVAMASVRYPSSMGVTFAVDVAVKTLAIDVSVVRFEPREGSGTRRAKEVSWNRVPLIMEPYELDVGIVVFNRVELAAGLDLFWRVRPPSKAGARSVTVGLVNSNRKPAEEFACDPYCWFAPTMSVRTLERHDGFVARPSEVIVGVDDDDLASYRLLYRHALEFATGHGCAADWELSDDPTRAVRVWATFTPRHELRLSDSNPAIVSEWFSLRTLATSGRAEVVSGLRGIVTEYRSWIETRRAESRELLGELREIAEMHLERCEESAGRMSAGIDRLESDDEALSAFQLMNEAMLQQRARSDWFRAADKAAGPIADGSHQWRAFQLAFILQSLVGIVDGSDSDRDLVDLLWFPTGGGKTEAYLGLIALTVTLRRIRGRGAGITVLMRYTLRLLTIQQFERAATLICALELQRQRDPDRLGTREIAIGLWVGGAATPLRLSEAKSALDKLRAHVPVDEGNPVQVHRCPWCGVPLDVTNYWITRKDPRLVIACKNDACEFEDGIPAWIVDEDVYRRRPSLLIGTADKFASLPWRDAAGDIFNLNSTDPPPELIIQDELHLISGPLGTLSGLYETAVDELCTDHGVRPKVIASTATIRRAHDQIRGLFAREVRQFPAPGIDARDNWFSIEARTEDKGTRLYVGVMAPGTSQTSLMVRVYAALLQHAATCEADENVRDAYWTLVGYFNSLRVLGGARMQVNDDVPDRIGVLANRDGDDSRTVERVIELTSRETSSEIPVHLRDMDRAYPDPYRLDVVLATNMISVGIDIDRLSLMAVMGQPQSAAEYIQATSRVGRRWPGLVIVMLNSARSRDRSHYESFRAFHSALYRQVESTSVTPFSPRAVDRALHAVLVGLARLLVPQYAGNDGAAAVLDHRRALDAVFEVIRRRVTAVDPAQLAAVEQVMSRIVDEWEEVAGETSLKYANPQMPTGALLVDATDQDTDPEGHFRTLWSLRDVDTESDLYLVRD